MKTLRRIVIGLAALIAILAIVAWVFLPREVTVSRSTSIDAPAATVYALVTDFRNFNKWSPWAERGEGVTEYEFDGPVRGTGAVMRWRSEAPDVGTGEQRIVAAEPYRQVDVALAFEGQGEARASYLLEPTDSGTEVTWTFTTDFGNDLFGRYLGLFFERWIAPDYEAGLKKLRELAESLPATDFAGLSAEEVEVPGVVLASTRGESGTSPEEISKALGEAYFRILTYLRNNGLAQTGPPRAIRRGESGVLRFEAAIPVDLTGVGEEQSGPVQLRESYAGPAIRVTHTGSYAGLAQTRAQAIAWLAAHGYERAGDSWDDYVTDPGEVSADELRTALYFPVR